MRVHFGAKMGDLIYALPVVRALARQHGPVDLILSPHCWQLIPVLWEQPYLASVSMDDRASYEMRRGVVDGWNYFSDPRGGINLSPQPSFYAPEAPAYWTLCYMWAAGVTELIDADRMALPSLVNHRRWFYGHEIRVGGVPVSLPRTVILAPESESLSVPPLSLWQEIAQALQGEQTVILIGKKREGFFPGCLDLRASVTVPVMARMIAEARGFLGVLSLPWHLARHSEVPALCLQEMTPGLIRSLPTDTAYGLADPKEWGKAIRTLKDLMAADALKETYV